MRRMSLTLVLCFLIVCSMIIPVSMGLDVRNTVESQPTTFGNGNTLYVGGSGVGNYSKIQNAINDANSGDTVFVFSGTYYERKIFVNKSLNIIGEDRNTTIIDCQYEDYPFALLADGIYLSGIHMKNSGTYPTWNLPGVFANCNYFRVENNIISNMKGSGVIIWDERHNNIVKDNVISKCEYGIALRYDSYDNEICSNLIFDSEYGILFNSGDAEVYENIIYNNDFGMYITHSSNSDIYDNYIFNNDIGINLHSDCSNNIIANNLIHNNTQGMLLDRFKSYNLIKFNTIIDNDYGIQFSNGCRMAELYRNEISNNKLGILVFWFSNNNKIIQNNLIGNDIIADIEMFSIFNTWRENYWNEPKTQPFVIRGTLGMFFIPWINIDWNPAQEPYDIGE